MLQFIIMLGLLAGIAKCFAIARRPTTNRKCVASLMVLLGAWMASIGWVWFHSLSPALESVELILGIIPSGLTVGAALLAIAGLKEYSRGKGFYTQGLAQAFTALAVSGLLLLLIGLTIAGGMWSGFSEMDHPSGGKPLVFEEQNFKFLHPGSRWTSLETNSLDPGASLALRRLRPELNFLVVAQKTPSEKYSLDDLAELARRNQSNAVDRVRVFYSGATSLDRLDGLRVHSEGEPSGRKFYYQHRLFLAAGWGYQLITWGPDRATVANEADYLSSRFQILELNRRSQTGTNSP
jgi:hypothetical protein